MVGRQLHEGSHFGIEDAGPISLEPNYSDSHSAEVGEALLARIAAMLWEVLEYTTGLVHLVGDSLAGQT